MTDLPSPAPLALISDTDLQAALKGIEEGWYRSIDLLPRFNTWARSQGRPEVTAKALGEAIRREFKPRKRSAHRNVAVWYLSDRVLTHRDWFEEN